MKLNMFQQYEEIKARYEKEFVFVHVGDNLELYDKDADRMMYAVHGLIIMTKVIDKDTGERTSCLTWTWDKKKEVFKQCKERNIPCVLAEYDGEELKVVGER